MLALHSALPLLRRSISEFRPFGNFEDEGREIGEELKRRLTKPGSIITLVLTFLAFGIISSLVEYAVTIVAVNLAAVEDTTGAPAAPKLQYTDDEDNARNDDPLNKNPLLLNIEEPAGEPTLYPSQPVTRGIRSTFRHLRAATGSKRSKFRGVSYAISYGILTAILGSFLALPTRAVLGKHIGEWIGYTVSAVLCAQLHAAWTHATIAMPVGAGKALWRFRRGAYAVDKAGRNALMLATFRARLAQGVSAGTICAVLAGITKIAKRAKQTDSVRWYHVALMAIPLVLAVFFFLALLLPTHIALVRTEAALLPEADTPIVPLDRTFAGKVVIETETKVEGIQRHLSMRGAFKSIDKVVYKRVLAMYVKMFAIGFALSIVFFHVLALEGMVLIGDLAPRILKWLKEANEKGMLDNVQI